MVLIFSGDWLICSRSIPVGAGGRLSFLFKAESHAIVWMDPILFIHHP